jgi:type I restriction-modification system DNA methylase subunit
MITQDNLADLLRYLEFTKKENIFKKEYQNGASIEVNFNTQEIVYAPLDATFKEGEFPSKDNPAKGFVIHRKTTLNFSAKENFVCLVCVHLLLKKGYAPKHIVFEPAFKSGHVNKPSFGDILVFDKEYNPLVLIENKTYGSEFSKEWNNMLKDGGQLFSYLGGMSQTTGYSENLVLYAADFDEKLVQKSHIITLKDNEKRIKELDNPKTFQNSKDKLFDVWSETYAKSFETKGLFEDDIEPYSIGKLKYTINDIEGLSHAEIRPIYHEFATILRNHAITDFEHSFYILVDLFLCKITDERNNPDDLQFRYKGITRDTPKEYCARLLDLYQQGKKQLFGIDVINKNESDISQIFEEKQRTKNGLYEGIKELFEEIKFYNIKKFNFIDVENKEDFELNFQILIEVTSLIQDIRLSDSETNHFFGDLFEGLLSKNVHQTEGQFFTPLPIVNFIIKSLPDFPNKESIKVLDYACGAGHFLTEFLKAYPKANAYGIEKSQPLSQVAKIATIINGAQDSHIVFKDALSIFNTQEVRFQGFDKESFDCLIANPPYSVDGFLNTLTEKDRNLFCLTELVDEKTYGSNGNIQCFFIERAIHFLKKDGLMAIVLPVSILSNNENLFKKTRELIFANFNILSIVGLNSRTFGSTGTNTIILFAQKMTKNSEGLLNSFISKREYKSYTNYKAIDVYIEKQRYNKEEYLALMQDGVLGTSLEASEVFIEYKRKFKPKDISKTMQKQWFKDSSLYNAEKKENSKENRELFEKYLASEKYKELVKTEYYNQFVLFVKDIEYDKLNTFIQIHDNEVVILQSPPDKIGNKSNKENVVKFLGYDWSSRKNDEGIKYITNKLIEEFDEDKKKKNDKDTEILEAINSIKYIETPLYSPNDAWDNSKFAFTIRKHIYKHCNKFSFNGNRPDGIEGSYNGESDDLLAYPKLSDLIKFDRGDFDKSISLNMDQGIKDESKYQTKRLESILVEVEGNKTKIAKDLIQSNGLFPVITQERGNLISGYTDNKNVIDDLPLIVFGDHSCTIKYVDFPFVRGADGTQLLKTDQNEVNTKYLSYYLSSIKIQNEDKYERHFKYLKQTFVPIPSPIEIQNKIVEECERVDEEYNASRMSIEEYRKKITEVFERLEVISKVGGVIYRLSNNDIFEISIGRRVLNTEVNPTYDIPVYSANVFEPFGMINKKLIEDFTRDSVIWGIDGDWMVNVIPANHPFYPTDHCGVMRIKTDEILPKYMAHLLEVAGQEVGFKRSYRASIDRIEGLTVKVAPVEEQRKAISEIEVYEQKIAEAKAIMRTCENRKQIILDSYLK